MRSRVAHVLSGGCPRSFTHAIVHRDARALAEVSDAAALDDAALVGGITASLRTLVVASFRAPRTRAMFQLLSQVNPTRALMSMRPFVARHDYVFALVCMLNVNLGAFDVPADPPPDAGARTLVGACEALALLQDVAACHDAMDAPRRRRVLRRLECSGALPVARDAPSYNVLRALLWGTAGVSSLECRELLDDANRVGGDEHVVFGGMDDEDESSFDEDDDDDESDDEPEMGMATICAREAASLLGGCRARRERGSSDDDESDESDDESRIDPEREEARDYARDPMLGETANFGAARRAAKAKATADAAAGAAEANFRAQVGAGLSFSPRAWFCVW